MGNLPISGLPEITATTSNAEYAVAQGGTTYKIKRANMANYGVFSSTGSQVSVSANTINIMSASTVEHSSGVVLSANTRFVMTNSGVYNIQFSAQFQQQANIDSNVSIWFRKNGNDIPRSNTEMAIDKNQAGPSKLVAAWNYVDIFNANEYIEIAWSSPDTTMQLLYQGTQTNPTRPSTPSLIVTVTQV